MFIKRMDNVHTDFFCFIGVTIIYFLLDYNRRTKSKVFWHRIFLVLMLGMYLSYLLCTHTKWIFVEFCLLSRKWRPEMVEEERTPLNKSNLLSGILLILFVLGIGVTLLFIGVFEDIEDFIILGTLFLVFSILVFGCVFFTVLRPYCRSGKVADDEHAKSYSHENIGFSRSEQDFKSTAASFERIKIDNDDDCESVSGQRRSESVIVDLKSRAGSAHSLHLPEEPTGRNKKKRVSFF